MKLSYDVCNNTITFDPNGGSGSITTATTSSDGTVTLPASSLSRDGYTFQGWYTDPTGGTQVTASSVFQGDTTVYARWAQNTTPPAGGSTGGGSSGGSASVSFGITAEKAENGKVSVSSAKAAKGDTVTITVKPDEGMRWIP